MFLVYLALIVAAVYFFTDHKERITNDTSGRKSAVDVLTMRFVNGEIDEEEYEKMKRAIRG
ncbi:MAG: SHOCT domain-containing protein [Anaerofustis sp.]